MKINSKAMNEIFTEYRLCKKRLVILDYGDYSEDYIIGKKRGLDYVITIFNLTYEYKKWLYNQGYYKLSAEDIRQFCIKNNLYTFGTNAEYERLLNAVDKYFLTVKDIAIDIYNHSRYLDGKSPKDLETEIIDTVIRED